MVRGSGRRDERAVRGSSSPPPRGSTLRDSPTRAPGDRRGGAGGARCFPPTAGRPAATERAEVSAGSGRLGFRFPPALGLGEREALSSGSAGLLPPPATGGAAAASADRRFLPWGGRAAVPLGGQPPGRVGAGGTGTRSLASCLAAAPRVAPCRGKGRAREALETSCCCSQAARCPQGGSSGAASPGLPLHRCHSEFDQLMVIM